MTQDAAMLHPLRLARVAHDMKKAAMADWAARHRQKLAHCALSATGTTGTRIMKKYSKLAITRLKSGPLGGDQQIGALIAGIAAPKAAALPQSHG